ncbi:MAG: rhamnan synthesis F family protein, partial [Caulobacteraceae bacterium]
MLRADRRRKRERLAIESSRIFDPDFYLRRYPDLAASGVDPLEHFLRFGAQEGRLPSPVFDPGWYVETYPDVAANGHNPLAHYILFGAAEGRDPNPMFSTRWYATSNAAARAATTPLDHFIVEGATTLRDPSLGFNMAWYARSNSDCSDEGLEPLSHYLLVGRAQGRSPSPLQSTVLLGEPVEDAWLLTVKAVAVSSDRPVLVFVTHAPASGLKPHVPPYLGACLDAGLQVVLIVATDAPLHLDEGLLGRLSGCVLRENRGYDFAAWAHVLRQNRDLYASPTLMLANDSVAMRSGARVVPDLLAAIAQDDADIIGLTQSEERGWHLQSYFLALKPQALSAFALHNFLAAVRMLDDKDAVIQSHEVTFSSQMQAAGLRCSALYTSQDATNQTLFHWRGLIEAGFPFVKILVLQGEFPAVDITDWESWLSRRGFDVATIQSTIAAKTASPTAPTQTPPLIVKPSAAALGRPKIAFIGPWNYANGLGAAGRGYLSALWRLDLDLNLHPVKLPFHIHERITPAVDVCDFIGPADLVIIHLNPDSWHLMTPEQQAIVTHAKARVGLWVWEMSVLPDAWRANLGRVDAVWTPSHYCAEVFAREMTRPVSVTPHVVTVGDQDAPAEAATLRATLGLAQTDRVILYVFDGASYLV